jgi:methyltransferase (TIGR00027 family)
VTDRGIDEFTERMYGRSGLDRLRPHLESAYGIRVAALIELELGVFRVERRDGPDWVARVFPAAKPVEAVEGDGRILRFLADHGFPAERCARAPAVTVHEGQGVLVTGYVAGSRPRAGERTFHRLGDLLGRLHTLPPGPGAVSRDGGAWHHLTFAGGPRAEIDAAIELLEATAGSRLSGRDPALRSADGPGVPADEPGDSAGETGIPAGGPADSADKQALYAELLGLLRSAEDGHDLPSALIHPDFVPANAVAGPDGGLTLVDWTGAGRGPRLWSLAFLLWAAGSRDPALAEAVVAGYRAHVRPEPDELARLAGAIGVRPLIFGCWALCTGRTSLAAVMAGWPATHAQAQAIAERAAEAFAGRSGPPASMPETVGIPEGVGETGLAIAAIRAEETARPDRLFADPLAGAFVAAAGWAPRRVAPGDRRAAVLRFWVVARTVFLDELLASACADGCRQVVLLGAGFDTRAFRLSWPPGVRFFELDRADVLDSKARVLTEQAARAGCERVPVVCDLREDWPGALLAAGFEPDRPAVWIAEGLLVYLTAAERDALLADVTGLSAPGSRLGLTMTSRSPSGEDGPGRVTRMMTLWRSAAPDDPAGWLAGHGWAARLASARDLLTAHGRSVPGAPAPSGGQPRRPRGLLIDATLGGATQNL